jgi:hypothetical protein
MAVASGVCEAMAQALGELSRSQPGERLPAITEAMVFAEYAWLTAPHEPEWAGPGFTVRNEESTT